MHHDAKSPLFRRRTWDPDANTGDELIGWDTDQFPTNLYLWTQIILHRFQMGGFTTRVESI